MAEPNHQTLKEVARQAPSLVVLSTLVYVFLSHLSDRDATHTLELEKIGQACHDHTTSLGANYERIMERTLDVLEENVKIQGGLAMLLQQYDLDRDR